MSEGHAKIYTSMLRSSVWVGQTKEQKILWVTMLALADAAGYVSSSIPGLARDAELTIQEVLDSLECLKAPDKWSRSKEAEGRRLVEVDGGWRIINHKKYREMRTRKQVAHAEAQKRYEAKLRGETTDQPQLREHSDGVTGRKPRIRKVRQVIPDATDAQKQKQKQKQSDQRDQFGSESSPLDSLASQESSGGGPKDLPGSARERPPAPHPLAPFGERFEAMAQHDPSAFGGGVAEPITPAIASTQVPREWEPNDKHRMDAELYGLDFVHELATFRATTFQRAYWDWPRRFDRWLLDSKREREREAYKQHQQGAAGVPRRNGSPGSIAVQPNAGRTGFEGVKIHTLDGDDDGEGGAAA